MMDIDKPLRGKKVAIIVENKFIPEEIEAYCFGFGVLGAEVEYLSRIFYGDYRPGHASWKDPVFYSDVDPGDNEPWESPHKLRCTLNENAKAVDRPLMRDVSEVDPNQYAAVIMSANYTSVRLRWDDFDLKNVPSDFNVRSYIRNAPVVKFFSKAMENKNVIKGALCHGLWLLTPYPELLKGRQVICHSVVMADIHLAGAVITPNKSGIVIDGDLVTGFSKHEVVLFTEAISKQILSISQ